MDKEKGGSVEASKMRLGDRPESIWVKYLNVYMTKIADKRY